MPALYYVYRRAPVPLQVAQGITFASGAFEAGNAVETSVMSSLGSIRLYFETILTTVQVCVVYTLLFSFLNLYFVVIFAHSAALHTRHCHATWCTRTHLHASARPRTNPQRIFAEIVHSFRRTQIRFSGWPQKRLNMLSELLTFS